MLSSGMASAVDVRIVARGLMMWVCATSIKHVCNSLIVHLL